MYESNGQDVKIRGTASHIAEKYLQLARDAQSSGDPIAAENYYQHAEHYFRLIAAAQEQLRQGQPYYQQQPQQPGGNNLNDDGYDDEDGDQPHISGEPFAPREPQPFNPQQQQHHQQPQAQPQGQHFQQRPINENDVERLPSFITGGQPQQPVQGQGQNGPNGQGGPNGQNGYDGSPDRFPLHRRRRRHRGPRDHSMHGDNDAPMPPQGPRPSED
jgi:hypothetical protein